MLLLWSKYVRFDVAVYGHSEAPKSERVRISDRAKSFACKIVLILKMFEIQMKMFRFRTFLLCLKSEHDLFERFVLTKLDHFINKIYIYII